MSESIAVPVPAPPAGSPRTPVVLTAVAAALFASAFVVFPAIYIPSAHNDGLVEAGDVTLGLIAPATFIVSVIARYKARRLLKGALLAGVTAPRSASVAQTVSLALALLSGIPAAIGLFVVLFLLIALAGVQG